MHNKYYLDVEAKTFKYKFHQKLVVKERLGSSYV